MAAAGPTPRALGPNMVAVVVTDDLVMRSEPGTGTSSETFKPWLQRRVQLYVFDGPVRASGYQWYEVMPLSSKYEDVGWVAAASKSGKTWIKPAGGAPSCPETPTTIAGLARLPSGVRLACFSGVPITVRARISGCGVSMGDAMHDPLIFNGALDPNAEDSVPLVLSDPDAAPCSDEDGWDGDGWLDLMFDPARTSPEALLPGAVRAVTGIFDHPAAKGCRWFGLEGLSEPDAEYCRVQFVVTGVE